jgi:hypothetical protein
MFVYLLKLPEHRVMKLWFLFLLLLSSCTTKPVAPEIPPTVFQMTEVNPNKWTALTRQNLDHLMQVYDLTPLLFTLKIQIESQVKSHSHPILTLNTRYAESPKKLFSVFVHEQLHWWIDQNKTKMDKAIEEIKALFPTLPATILAKDTYSTYQHLIICFLEYETMIHYLQKKEANKILKDFIQKDNIYPWVNTQVYLKYKPIESIVKKYKLSVKLK